MISHKSILSVIVLVILSGIVTGQNRDSQEAAKYSELAWKFKDRFPDSSKLYAFKALEIAEQNKLYRIHAFSLADISNYYKRKEKYRDASSYLHRSLAIRRQYLDSCDLASGYNLLGLLSKQQEQYDSASYYFENALRIAIQCKNPLLSGKIRDGLAMTLMNLEEYKRAQDLLSESLKVAYKLKDSMMLAKSWQNLGVLYERIGRSNDALNQFNKAKKVFTSKKNVSGEIDILINSGAIYLKQGNFVSALNYLESAKKKSLEIGLTKNLSSLYNNLGLSYYGLTRREEATDSYSKAIELALKNKKYRRWVEANLNLMSLYLDQDRPTEVVALYLSINERIRIEGWNIFLPRLFELQSKALGRIGRYEDAFRVSQSAILLQDSINNEMDLAQERAMELERLTKEQELLKQQIQIQSESLARQKAERKSYQLSIVLLVIILAATTFILFIRRRHIVLKLLSIEREKELLLEKKTTALSTEKHNKMVRIFELAGFKRLSKLFCKNGFV